MNARLGRILWSSIVPVVLLVLWWVWSARSTSLYFPPLSSILVSFGTTWFGEGFGEHLVPSLQNLAIGYVLGSAFGVAGGAAIGLVRPLERMLAPFIEYARAMPPPALLPFAILLLGIGAVMKVGLIAFGVLFVVLLNTIDGVRAGEPALHDVGAVYRVPFRYRLFGIVLAGALPQIMAGLRTGLSLALLLTIISEMVAANHGIGYFILQAQQNFAYVEMWSGMLLLALFGLILNLAFAMIERRVLFWQAGAAAASGVPGA
jgi:ABC-type nitrate/sulfonate/bicarbonate transport system permease component